ncbi:MAG: hypothetical protein KDC02_07440, partial [Flavobacteriales bacterium]|nr:hypothetical protein [Flavobacteriales bacterium]
MGRQSNGVVKAGRVRRRVGDQQPGVKEQRWPGTWMALGIFFAIFSFLWLGPRTLVPGQLLVKLLVVCGLVTLLLPYRSTGLRLGMERFEWFLFNLLALGPTLSGLILWSNLAIHGPVTWGEEPVGRSVVIELPANGGSPERHTLPWPGEQRFSRTDWISADVRGWR